MSGTETIDPRNAGLDMWPDEAILDALLDGQRRAVSAVEAARDALASAASAIAARLGTSGRIVYAGAGSSGIIAALDGIELLGTYGWPAERVALVLASGDRLAPLTGGEEDDEDAARSAIAALALTRRCGDRGGRKRHHALHARRGRRRAESRRAGLTVGGNDITNPNGTIVRSLQLVRAPEDLLVKETGTGLGSPTFYADTGAFNITRELELKNIYQLGGQRIDPKTFMLSIRKGTDQPYVTSIQAPGGPVPYIEAAGLDNYDETNGTPVFGQHDGRVDGTAAGGENQLHVAVDFENGLLFLPDPHPFSPRLGAGGQPFDNGVANVLSRRAILNGPPDSANAANPNIYRKYVNQGALDAVYYLDVSFTASAVGNEIQLGRGNILAGSEVVSVNGVALEGEPGLHHRLRPGARPAEARGGPERPAEHRLRLRAAVPAGRPAH